MIAILASKVVFGQSYARSKWEPGQLITRGQTHGVVFEGGTQTEFRIITTEEQLRGLQLTDFRVADSGVPDSLVLLARTRIR